MSLRFVRIKRRPMSFERLSGVKVEAFERIVDRLRPLGGGLSTSRSSDQARFRGSVFDGLAVLSQLQHSVFYWTVFGDRPIILGKRRVTRLKRRYVRQQKAGFYAFLQRTPGPYTTLLSLKRSLLCTPIPAFL